MFEISLHKQALLTPLLMVSGAVDKKQSVSLLSNILMELTPTALHLTATDLEIEITSTIHCIHSQGEGAVTVPTKKILEIIRSLEDEEITIKFDQDLLSIKQGRGLFKLSTQVVYEFPKATIEAHILELDIKRDILIYLLQSTAFAMPQQDIRIFLNGLLLDIDNSFITAVGMDGHRMAVCRHAIRTMAENLRVLLPRKSIQEILKLANHITDETLSVSIGKNHVIITTHQYRFLTKLIEARFPPYTKAIPLHQDKKIIVNKDLLKRALQRIMIMAHEKFKAIQLNITPGLLTLVAMNQSKEEATESIEASTEGGELTIGMNAQYLLDVIQQIPDGDAILSFTSSDSSILIETSVDPLYQYIIMPMKI